MQQQHRRTVTPTPVEHERRRYAATYAGPVAVVKINAIEVPDGAGAELERRFAARAGAVEGSPGFLGFELLRPTGGETRYFVYTRS
ncbi:hypothetical protein GCM10027047_32900 [Rhodococcus aerolatus]